MKRWQFNVIGTVTVIIVGVVGFWWLVGLIAAPEIPNDWDLVNNDYIGFCDHQALDRKYKICVCRRCNSVYFALDEEDEQD